MSKARITVDLPDDVAALLTDASRDTGKPRAALVVDAIREFLGRRPIAEDAARKDDERAFAEAKSAYERGDYVLLDDLLDDLDGRRHASR